MGIRLIYILLLFIICGCRGNADYYTCTPETMTTVLKESEICSRTSAFSTYENCLDYLKKTLCIYNGNK